MIARRIGIVGLGVMGAATGRHLVAAGHEVHGFDVDVEKCSDFARAGAQVHESAVDLAATVDTIITWLPSADTLGVTVDAIIASRADQLVLIEMGTLSLESKRAARERLATSGVAMLDCPVSGTGQQAQEATLVVYGSGNEDVYASQAEIFAAMGSHRYLGEFGNGTIMKYIANLLVTVHTLAAAEAHNLGVASGLDPALVQEVIAQGVGSSRMWEIRGAMMAASVYEPPAGRLDIIKKDAGLISEHAAAVGANTPALELALQLFGAASDAGLGSLDAAAIRLHLESLA